MSKRRKTRSRRSSSFSVKKKRSGFRTFVETVMGVSIGLLIFAFGIWWIFFREAPENINFNQNTASAIKNNIIDDVGSYEAIRDSGGLDDQLHLLSELDQWPKGAETPVRLDTLNKRVEIAQTILKHDDLKESQRVSTAKSVIEAKGQIYGIYMGEEIDSDGSVATEFLDICNSFVDDPNEEIKRTAKVARVKAIVYQKIQGGLDGSANILEQSIGELIEQYPNNEVVISTVRLLAIRIKQLDRDLGVQLEKNIVTVYDRQPVADRQVLHQIRTLKDVMILDDSGIARIITDAIRTDNFDDYLQKMGELTDLPDTGTEFVDSIYKLISVLESSGKHDVVMSVLKRMKESSPSRTDEVAKFRANRLASFGLIRNFVVGRQLDFSDIDSSGEAVDLIQFLDRPCIIVFHSPNNPNSQSLFKSLNETFLSISNTGVKIVTIAVEKPASGQLDVEFNSEWINIQSSEDEEARSEIFKRCPVTQVPYFVIVDYDGIVNSINVPLGSLTTRIQELSKERSEVGNQ